MIRYSCFVAIVMTASKAYTETAKDSSYLYKRFENGGLRWPRHREDAVALTKSQIKALLEGISPLPQKRIRPAIKGPGY